MIARRVAEFIANLNYASIPKHVRDKGKTSLLDTLGVCVAGSSMPWSRAILAHVIECGGSAKATVIGHTERTSVVEAVFANGTFGHAVELDEQHNASTTHPGPVLVPAALAVAESTAKGGRELLVSLIAGYEIMTRVGMAISPEAFTERGFHPTSVTGTIGAATVASKLLDLDIDQTTQGIAIAGNCSAGLFEYLSSGGEFKRVHAGMGAHAGVRAAFLAGRGITGPSTIFEGDKGFVNAFSGSQRTDGILSGLGSDWQILNVAYKPYACCRLVHSSLDAVNEIRENTSISADQVESIEVRTCSTMSRFAEKKPKDVIGAQLSIPFGIAMSFLYGNNDLRSYSIDALRDQNLFAFAQRVTVVADRTRDSLYPEQIGAEVEVVATGGERYTASVPYPKGEPENPMTASELESKFRNLTTSCLGDARTKNVMRLVNELESQPSVAELMSNLTSIGKEYDGPTP